jgi:hypothetical protein
VLTAALAQIASLTSRSISSSVGASIGPWWEKSKRKPFVIHQRPC